MSTSDPFFNNPQRLSSKIKTDIVTKYFLSYLSIMNNPANNRSGRIGYVDLFAGPGYFTDAEGRQMPSTPLAIMDLIAANPVMAAKLYLVFNDANPEHVEALKRALEAHPAYAGLRHRISVTQTPVTAETMPNWVQRHPTLYFLDPYGYGGLTAPHVTQIAQQPGSDVLFFMNYNRLNMDLNHDLPKIRQQAEHLLGTPSYCALQERLSGVLSPGERQKTITDHLWTQLERGGRPHGHYVVPFEFKFKDKERTSHYLVFVSKNANARKIIREVMAGLRTVSAGPFEYSPRQVQQAQEGRTALFSQHSILGDDLLKFFAGQQKTVDELIAAYDQTHPRLPFTEKDYKDSLKQLRTESLIKVTQRSGKPVRTDQMPGHAYVSFS